MKINLILFWMIAVILPLSSFAQGVDFKSLTMKEAQAVAEKEKKMIFIDFYTTWCGPCKMRYLPKIRSASILTGRL